MMMTEGNQSEIYGSSRKICVFGYQITCCSSTMAQIVETEELILEMERNGEILASKLVHYLRELGTYKDAIFILWWPELKFIVRSTLQIVGWLSLQQWNAQNWPLLSSCEKALLWIYWNHICCWYTACQENYGKLIILQRSELIHN